MFYTRIFCKNQDMGKEYVRIKISHNAIPVAGTSLAKSKSATVISCEQKSRSYGYVLSRRFCVTGGNCFYHCLLSCRENYFGLIQTPDTVFRELSKAF